MIAFNDSLADLLADPVHILPPSPHMPPPEATLTVLNIPIVAVAELPTGTLLLVPPPRDEESDEEWLKRCVRVTFNPCAKGL